MNPRLLPPSVPQTRTNRDNAMVISLTTAGIKMLKESIADGLVRYYLFIILPKWTIYTSTHDTDLIHVYRRNIMEI